MSGAPNPPAVCWSCFTPPNIDYGPFSGNLGPIDTLRCIVLGLAVVLIVLCVVAAAVTPILMQRLRYLVIGMMTVLVGSIELFRLGYTANWRLFVVTASIVWGVASMLSYLLVEPAGPHLYSRYRLRRQRTQPPPDPPDDPPAQLQPHPDQEAAL